MSNYQGGLGAHLFVNEDYRAAIAAWVKSADLNATNTLTDLAHAIRAALWAGTVQRRRAPGALRRRPYPWANSSRLAGDGGLPRSRRWMGAG